MDLDERGQLLGLSLGHLQVPHPLLVVHHALLHATQHVVVVCLVLLRAQTSTVGILARQAALAAIVAVVVVDVARGVDRWAGAGATRVHEVAQRVGVKAAVEDHALAGEAVDRWDILLIRIQERRLVK